MIGAILALGAAILLTSPTMAAEEFAVVQGDQFTYKGQVIRVKGTNYYPRDHHWATMWDSWDWTEICIEIDMMHSIGINCARILVPYAAGGWNAPNVPSDRVTKLTNLVNQLGTRGIRSCITLFDWETSFPTAGSGTETQHKTYIDKIVGPLKDNKYVLMWDVKNEPDHPSNINGYDDWDDSPTDRTRILSWLDRMVAKVRSVDVNHPVSAGIRWWTNTKDFVDNPQVGVCMFHSYWPNIAQEISDVKVYMGSNQRPINLEEFGWPTNPCPANYGNGDIYDYTEQRQLALYTSHLTALESANASGCIQWMTFDAKDYTSDKSNTFEDFFGIWKYNYTLKPAGIYYRDHFLTVPFGYDVPPQAVTGLTSFGSDRSVHIAWTNPWYSTRQATMVRYKTSGYPTSPTDGFLVCDKASALGKPDAFDHNNLVNGVTYYYSVYTHTSAPSYSPVSYTASTPAWSNCLSVKNMTGSIGLGSKVITAIFPNDSSIFISELNRTSGIRVVCSVTGYAVGDVISLTGSIGNRTYAGIVAERQVVSPTITKLYSGATVSPVAMSCWAVGGRAVPPRITGVTGGIGVNNMGLLVKIAGRVTYLGGTSFYVDDGSNVADGTGHIGVQVKYPPSPPTLNVGDVVSVVGIVEGYVQYGWTANGRYIEPRSASDVVKRN